MPVSDRAEAWREITTKALVPTKIELPDPASFSARLRTMPLGAVQMTEMSYGPHLSRRTPALIRQSDPEHYQFALIRTGRQGIDQARTRARLCPGEMVLYDSSRPFDASVKAGPPPAESVLLQFPKRLLPLRESQVNRLLAVNLPGVEGVGRLLAQFMISLVDEHAKFGARDAARLGTTAIDLITSVLAHRLDGEMPIPSQSAQRVLFLRITSFIDQHLDDADLKPATMASAHQISSRYLQRIFQMHGTTPGAYLRLRRLDRCRRDLADPGLSHVTIRAIAARWGFPQAAEFSRTFRATAGMPPSDYRNIQLGH
ncbi:AraC family transcriptional regulator [Streptomyces sp. NPDC050610]|uniref:AraC family transcriptional regulator n=1 Tax=Streptomyces sp. NPDC050610 TaxID=3157097 RepID=UPI00343218C8